ncbi:MAG: transcription termination factor NusA [Holosporales bacterium]|nr:transcription termination factor NusA [Holosporales bacterium]
MNKRIKAEEGIPPIVRNEILQVADVVAKDKGIGIDVILSAMEDAILKTVQMKYGEEKTFSVIINRKTGEIEVYRLMTVVDVVSDINNHISLEAARDISQEASVDDVLKDRLPAMEFGRIAAKAARYVVMQHISTAERENQLKEFSNRIGEIIVGIVKRIEFSSVIIDINRTEGVIRKSEMLPNEVVKVGDRVRVLLVGLNSEPIGPLLQLSRTHPDFLKKLFEQEVPEVYNGVVRIMAVARDPGSKSKMAVTTSDPNIDPIGACVGIKGSRVQAVVNELGGEKIDIIQWSDNQAMFIINGLSSAEVTRIVMEESGNRVTVVVPNDQLSVAIGRRGQNVRLASKLTGWTINVTTEEEDTKARAKESERILSAFSDCLDVDEVIARLLMGNGFTTIEEVANAKVAEIASIEGFDEDIATEIKDRAIAHMADIRSKVDDLCKARNVAKDLMEYELLRPELLEVLVKADIKTLNDLGDLSADELLEITGNMLSQSEAMTLIMKVRENWFN